MSAYPQFRITLHTSEVLRFLVVFFSTEHQLLDQLANLNPTKRESFDCATLVTQSSNYGRCAWNFYCDCHGHGVRDPRRASVFLGISTWFQTFGLKSYPHSDVRCEVTAQNFWKPFSKQKKKEIWMAWKNGRRFGHRVLLLLQGSSAIV